MDGNRYACRSQARINWGGLCDGLTTHPRKKNNVAEAVTEESHTSVSSDQTCSGTNKERVGAPENIPHKESGMNLMKFLGESPWEARKWKRGPLSPKNKTKIGIWNVRTMYQTGKLMEIERIFEREKYDLLGICESRWKGGGEVKTMEGNIVLYSGGQDKHERGVAMLVGRKWKQTIMEWNPVNERILYVRFNSKQVRLSVIVAYAPTEVDDNEEKELFYEQLESVIKRCKQQDLRIVMGDMNAKVGSDNEGLEVIMGKHGCGVINENGQRLIEFCINNEMLIGGTLFPHKEIHKKTWTSPDGKTRNQIDHIMINRKWRSSLYDVKVRRGADVGSDHFLVMGKLKLKLCKDRVDKSEDKDGKKWNVDINKLKRKEVREEFNSKIKSKFQLLKDECSIIDEDRNRNDSYNIGSDDDGNGEGTSMEARTEVKNKIEERWKEFVDVLKDVSEETLKKEKTRRRRAWIKEETIKIIMERDKIHNQILSTKSERIREKLDVKYRALNREVKRCAKRDKNEYYEEIAEEAENAAGRGEMNKVYKITKDLKGIRRKECVEIRDKEGNIIQRRENIIKRWKEHFEEVLNREDPNEKISEEEMGEKMDMMQIKEGKPSRVEIVEAIKTMKNKKAAGMDGIKVELLKEGLESIIEKLEELYGMIWEREEIPEDWKKGKIITIPKKGDTSRCDNWRGITLLSVPGKIFSKIIMNRLKEEIDKRLRKEQAGFRHGRSCTDQIFIIRNIIEQCNEWRRSIYVNFIDFEKAFDSLHQDTLWRILEKYGIPTKVIRLIKIFYKEYKCVVEVNKDKTEMFRVKTGVRQGCNMSALLFIIALDWIMRKTVEEKKRGITWKMMEQLEDLDFADDICLLSHTYRDSQEKMERVAKYSGMLGLRINVKKTKSMVLNTGRRMVMELNGKVIEKVEEFNYLGAKITKNGGSSEDIKQRICKAKVNFNQLGRFWRAKKVKMKTKIKIYKSNIRSVLLYGCETWSPGKKEMDKLRVFQNSCMRRILGVIWPKKMRNEELIRRTEIEDLEEIIKRRRYNYLGHLWRSENEVGKTAVKWTPGGTRGRGRPGGTWRRSVEEDMKKMKWTWSEMRRMAGDRQLWKTTVAALCARRSVGS